MKLRLTLFILIICQLTAFAQDWKSLKSIKLNNLAHQVSIDRQGNLYVSSLNGAIDKYSINGELQSHYSPTKKSSPHIIEAWQGLRVFVFYKDFQEYSFFDRFLSESERYTFGNQLAVSSVSLSTIAADNNIWVLNAQELSLKKIDTNSNEVISETNLNLILKNKTHDFTYIREYQNLVFISDSKNGLLVFDNIGNYLETLPLFNISFFSFKDSSLISIQNGKMIYFDIYTKQKKEVSLPDPSYTFVLMENKRVFLFKKETLDIFELN
ncbi:hypothetical protein [Roseivirga ehrenbergii]|uniref:hypothetical protein n=1 Tax=Roseivirga ehrenbergii (strain DSM 102268 / JCM 13514 / KCTC 12282 / NCIMB 14502 / KMM 6017) TaxID=279360 RepID=UPI0010533308|nr:hypothetical protein [Roseivirga ehrenbergii]